MEIRKAKAGDAEAVCQVLRRSITELCYADHRNDPAILGQWLRNKTPESFTSWISQHGTLVLVTVEDGIILAVGLVTGAGEIGLNYVSPDARFRGISRALLGALEAQAVDQGTTKCRLTSTETARRFYRTNRYVDGGAPVTGGGSVVGYPMFKILSEQ